MVYHCLSWVSLFQWLCWDLPHFQTHPSAGGWVAAPRPDLAPRNALTTRKMRPKYMAGRALPGNLAIWQWKLAVSSDSYASYALFMVHVHCASYMFINHGELFTFPSWIAGGSDSDEKSYAGLDPRRTRTGTAWFITWVCLRGYVIILMVETCWNFETVIFSAFDGPKFDANPNFDTNPSDIVGSITHIPWYPKTSHNTSMKWFPHLGPGSRPSCSHTRNWE